MSRPCFLISGETSAILNLDWKMSSEKNRLARVEMSFEKTEEQDLMSEVGMKSWREDLVEGERRSLATSSGVTGGSSEIGLPVIGQSVNEQSGN